MSADEAGRRSTRGLVPVAALIAVAIVVGGVVWWQYAQWNDQTQDDVETERFLAGQPSFEDEFRAGAQTVPELIEKLASPDRSIQVRAVFVLQRFGPEAVAAYPALVGLLEGDDPNQPWFTAPVLEALGHIGHERELLAPRVAELLASPRIEIFEAANRFLVSTGPAVVPYVVPLLNRDDDVAVRAVQLLHKLEVTDDETLRQIRELQTRPNGPLQSAAMMAVLDSGHATDEEIRTALARLREDPKGEISPEAVRAYLLDLDIGVAALKAIQRRGKEGQTLLPNLLAVVETPHMNRILPNVCDTIAQVDPERTEVMARLNAAAKGADLQSFRMIGQLILRLGGDTSELAEWLLELERKDQDDCSAAASVLCVIAPERSAQWLANRPLDSWYHIFENEMDGRFQAMRAQGPEAALLAGRIVASMRKRPADSSVKSDLRVLAWLGPAADESAPFLCELLEEMAQGKTQRAVPNDVLNVFRSIGPLASGEIPRLTRCYDKVRKFPDLAAPLRGSLQWGLLESLYAVGADPATLKAGLRELFDSTDLAVQVNAAGRMLALGSESDAAIVRLIEAVRDSRSPELQVLAIQTLGREGSRSASAIEPLTLLIDHPHEAVRREVVRALVSICRPAKTDSGKSDAWSVKDSRKDPRQEAAVAGLARALEDPSREIRMAAAQGLSRLGPSAESAKTALERAASDWRNGLRFWIDPYRSTVAGAFPTEQNSSMYRSNKALSLQKEPDPREPTVREVAMAVLGKLQTPPAAAPDDAPELPGRDRQGAN